MRECKKCAECCKFLSFSFKGLNTDRLLKDYYKKHGCKIKGTTIIVPSRCKQLTEDNLCKLHGKSKPVFCKIYKGSGNNRITVPEGCGYNDKK